MLNQSGVTTTKGFNTNQILASTQLQYSVSVIVANTGVSEVGGKKIIKAGTPLAGDLITRTAFTQCNDGTAVAVLLHDVDVTAGNANAAALVFGFVDYTKLDSSVKALLTSEVKKALTKITFVS